MKSLKDQIEFIDKFLIVLYGFKGVFDYTHVINISDPDDLSIDLVKLNQLIPQFRKIFHAKNFSLHKTNYEITSKSQAVCLLKTCLTVTSIPFDISLRSKKKYLRIITINNILNNYYMETVKKADILPLIFENSCSLKKQEMLIKGETFLNNVISTHMYEFFLSPNKLIQNDYRNHNIIKINMKKYNLRNKNIKTFKLKFISRINGGEKIISDSFIEFCNNNIIYEIEIGGGIIFYKNFINGENILLPDLFLMNKTLTYHDVYVNLYNIGNLKNIIDFLEIEITCEYVYFSNYIESILDSAMTEQLMVMDNKYNILRTMSGMAGATYDKFITYDTLKSIRKNTDIFDHMVEKNLVHDDNNSHLKHNPMIVDNIKGNYVNIGDDDFKDIFYNDDDKFICWNITNTIENNKLNYYKIKNNDKYIHTYYIDIYNAHNGLSINKLEIHIPNLNNNIIDNVKLFMDIREITYVIENQTIKMISNSKHILLNNCKTIELVFETNQSEEPIKNTIHTEISTFKWNEKYFNYDFKNKNNHTFNPHEYLITNNIT